MMTAAKGQMAPWWFRLLRLLVLLHLQMAVVVAVDYCQLPSCPGGSHTACKFKPGAGPSDKCSKDANGLSASDKDDVLNEHNKLRRQLATGQLDGFAGATDMETMKWDSELETIAQTWADQCDYGHDACRNVERWPVGQNIAMTGSSGGFQSQVVEKVNMWWDEYKEYSYKDGTFYFASGTGHFTQMAWAKTNLLGCGRSTYVKGGFTNEYLVCNYGPAGNVQGQKMYTAASPPLVPMLLAPLLCILVAAFHLTLSSVHCNCTGIPSPLVT